MAILDLQGMQTATQGVRFGNSGKSGASKNCNNTGGGGGGWSVLSVAIC